MAEYKEPSNEQLARFLVVYARNLPGTEHLQLSPPVLESLLSQNPHFRAGALRHHRKFKQQIDELNRLMEAGALRCEFVRPNGKRCPNHNQPGSFYCGLHIDEEG